MKVNLEQLAQPYLLRLVEEDKETIAKKTNAIWQSKKDSVTMDGFRKGKVPQDIVEKTQGFENLYRTYIDELIATAIKEANASHSTTIMDIQQIVPEKLDKDGIILQIMAYLKPKVYNVDPTDIELDVGANDPTKEEISKELSAFQQKAALKISVKDRGCQYNDLVVLSFTGYQKDKSGKNIPFQGGSVSRREMEFKEGSFIPGFGEQILNMKAEESKTFDVTFPENYHATQLAGKQATFDITVHEIFSKLLPDLDDEFAITCGKNSLQELVDWITEELKTKKTSFNRKKVETELCLKLLEKATFDPFPQTMIQKRLQLLLQQEAHAQGQNPQDYLSLRKISQEQFFQSYYHIALRDLKVQLLLDHVATEQKVEPSEEDKSKYLSEEAKRLGTTPENLKQISSDDQIESQVKLYKAYDFLLSKVKLNVKE